MYKRMRYRKKVKGLTKNGHFDEKHAALYFVDVLHGLAYLHRYVLCIFHLISVVHIVVPPLNFDRLTTLKESHLPP